MLPERVWLPTIKCGCGECRFHPVRECPKKDDPKAILLWSSRERGNG